jgi:hypothetical protein
MADVIYEQRTHEDTSSGTSLLIGLIFLILVVVLLFYGLPFLRGGVSQGPSVQVPGKVDVNVNQPKK